MRASNTASTACCSAGNAGSPRAWIASQRSSTSCHSMHASMKLGATGRPSPTRRSVSASASCTKRSRCGLPPGLPCTASRIGNTPRCSPCLRSSSRLFSAWPVCSSLIISSKIARSRHVGQQRRHLLHRRLCLRIDGEAQLGGEAHHADDAHRVLAVARGRVADHAQHALLAVAKALVVVDHHLPRRVVVQRIDAEVAPRRVLDLRPPDVVAQHAPAGIDHVALARQLLLRGLLVAADLVGRGAVQQRAEGRDFDHLMVAPAAEDHVHDAEAPADDEGAAEQRLHLLGRGVGGHVEVLRPQAHQQVAHRTADDEGLVPGLLQRAHHAHRALVEQTLVDAVFFRADLDALAQRHRGLCCVALAEQAVDEFFDHANSRRMGQPRSSAMRCSAGAGLVATGWLTLRSSGRSLVESL